MKSKITPRQLNKSLDERLLKPTDLIDALNVAIRTNEDGQGGVVKNVESNAAVEFLGVVETTEDADSVERTEDIEAFPGSNYVIGTVSDDEVGVVYLFVYNSNSKHSIWAYSTEAKSYRLIFTSSLLNFPQNGFVSADFVKIKRVVEAEAIADSLQDDVEGGSTQEEPGDGDDEIFDDDDEFVTDINTPGCTDPDALNYDPNATENDGSCVLPSPFEIPYCIGVDFSTLANHIYGPFNGVEQFPTTSQASISLNEDSPLLDSDPFKDGVDIENVVDRVTCKITFQNLNGLPADNPFDLEMEYSTEDLVRETNLTSRSRGLQYSSQGVIVVDGSILDTAYRAKAEIKVIFKEAWTLEMNTWLDEMLASTENAMWNRDFNASIPHHGRPTFVWNVDIFNGAERTDINGNSLRLRDFINESPNYLITNAVGFKTTSGIKAGTTSNNSCLTTSMENGQLIDQDDDMFVNGLTPDYDNATGEFKDIGHILFPGFGFGCDTPHVKVVWRNVPNTDAGNRSALARFVSDFRHTPEWQAFEALFAETTETVNGEQEEEAEDDTAARNRDEEVPSNIYVFFTTNDNDPIYEQTEFEGNALQQQINNLYPPETQISYYGSFDGAPPGNFNTNVLIGYPGPSINGTTIGSTEVTGGTSGLCNFFYFPLTQNTIVTDTDNAYRPTSVYTTLSLKRVFGFPSKPLATLPLGFGYQNLFRNVSGGGSSIPSQAASRENKLNDGGTQTVLFVAKVSGEGTLDFTNRLGVSIRQPQIEPANQQQGFYEFDETLSGEDVTGGLYIEDNNGNFEDASEHLKVLGVGGGGTNDFGTFPGNWGIQGDLTNPVTINGRLYSIGFRAYIKGVATYGFALDRLRITNGLPPSSEESNIKYLQATFSDDRKTVDGVAVNEESTADPITLGDESSTANDRAGGTSSATDTNNTDRTVPPASTAPASSRSSTQRRAKNKYGY